MLYYSNMKTLVVHPVIFFFVLGITQIHEYQLKALLLKDKIYRKKKQRRSLLCWLAWIQKNNFITETTRWLANTWSAKPHFPKKQILWNIKYRHICWWGPGIYYSCIFLVHPIRPWNLYYIQKNNEKYNI